MDFLSAFADGAAGVALATVFEPILLIIQGIVAVLSFVMGLLMGWIGFVMQWQVATNNEVVQVAWAIGRDISNIFFIVGLIIIAFATMFRTFGVLQSFHWKSALPRLLVAAILVNLSLAIGQTIVLASNQVTKIMGGIIETSGFQLVRVLKTSSLKNSYHIILSENKALLNDPNAGVDTGALAFQENDRLQELAAEDRQAYIDECTQTESQKNASFWQNLADKAPRLALAPALGPVGFVVSAFIPTTSFENIDTGGVRKTFQECIDEYTLAQQSLLERAGILASSILEWAGVTSASAYLYFMATGLLNIFMLCMVIISLGAAVVFYMFRVMAIWVLLFLSSLAFGFWWLPGGESLKRWWNVFLGWNLFGPIYLFFLIIGMSFLTRQGDLVATLTATEGVGAVGGLFQIIFFYIFAAVVFTGGLLIALNSSFATAVKSTPLIGKGAERLGAFSAVAWSTAFGRRVAQTTRVPAYYQALKERAAQEWREKKPATIAGIPTRIKSQEELTSEARARLGVYGGEAQVEALRKGRVEDATKRFKQGVDEINVFDEDTGALDMKATHEARMDFLRSKMNSNNRDEAIAARQELLKYGDESMTFEEMKRTQELLPGKLAQAEFEKNMKSGDVDPLKQFQWYTGSNPDKDEGEAAEQFFGAILRDPNKFKKLSPPYAIPGHDIHDKAFRQMKAAADRIWDPNSTEKKDQQARHRAKMNLVKAADTPQKRQLALDIFGG